MPYWAKEEVLRRRSNELDVKFDDKSKTVFIENQPFSYGFFKGDCPLNSLQEGQLLKVEKAEGGGVVFKRVNEEGYNIKVL